MVTRWQEGIPAFAREIRMGINGVRIAGVFAILFLAIHGSAEFGGSKYDQDVIAFGAILVGGFLWLAISGAFGYGAWDQADWVAVLPFVVALAIREAFTLHSIQELEIQFVSRPTDKHSVVYPLLQILFLPLVHDQQMFTMHMNGVLGALACLPLYGFVRARMESRTAGFLAALFVATHSLVARFSPTDGSYSLLLLTWFSGLVLLSNPRSDARGVLAGVTLVGIASTLRVEGTVLLGASLLMLDLRRVWDGIRRHRTLWFASALVAAALIALQMHFVMRLNVVNVPTRLPSLSTMLWSLETQGPIFALLVALGAVSVVVTRRSLGLSAFLAMLLVIMPVVDSGFPIAMHRLVPACALQATIAGIGAYAAVAWLPGMRRSPWLAALPGTLMAFWILAGHHALLTRPYVFTDEYELVRHGLTREVFSKDICTLMTFKLERLQDFDVHDFAQIVPNVDVVDCGISDCTTKAASGGCVYYVRSAAAYFHEPNAGVSCPEDQLAAGCLRESVASFERSVVLEPIELRTVDLWATFGEWHFPRTASIGLFRVHPKTWRGDADPARPST